MHTRSKMFFSSLAFALLAGVGLCSPQAHAESRLVAQANKDARRTVTTDSKGNQVITIKGADRVKIKKVTQHTFREGVIGGTVYGPSGRTIVSRQRSRFNSLIQYRADFTKEMWRSAKNL